jgi:hypothetical protein
MHHVITSLVFLTMHSLAAHAQLQHQVLQVLMKMLPFGMDKSLSATVRKQTLCVLMGREMTGCVVTENVSRGREMIARTATGHVLRGSDMIAHTVTGHVLNGNIAVRHPTLLGVAVFLPCSFAF